VDKNTWGLRFSRINDASEEIEDLLSLNIGDEPKTRTLFIQIYEEYEADKGIPSGAEYLIELLDETDSIIDDIAVTREEAIEIASRLGHAIN